MMGIFIHSLTYILDSLLFLWILHCSPTENEDKMFEYGRGGAASPSPGEGFRYGFPEILMGWLRFEAASLMCQEFE